MFKFKAWTEPTAIERFLRLGSAEHRLHPSVLLTILVGWLVSALVLAPLATAQDVAKSQRVLILFTARRDLPINVLWERGIRAGLKEVFTSAVAFECEYVDFDRLKSPEYREQWLSLLRVKYETSPPDVIIPVHDLAAKYFASTQPEIFPQAQVVFCSINEGTLSLLQLTPRMTGVSYRLEFQQTLEIARQMVPSANRVVVVAGASEMDRDLLQGAQSQFAGQDQEGFTYWIGLPLEEVCARAAQLGPENLILFLSFESDLNGQMSISTRDALQSISSSAAVPVFGLFDSLMGGGIVGGQMARVEEQGRRAGAIAGRLLQGERAQDIKFSGTEMNRPMFDWRELQRWEIPLQTLPTDSLVLYRVPTLWSRYWPTVVLIATILGIQFLLIVGLLFNRRKRQLAQDELQDMLDFQTAFCNVSSALLEHVSGDLHLTLDTAIQRFGELVGVPYCYVWRRRGDRLEVIGQRTPDKKEASSPPRSLYVNSIPALWDKVKRGEKVPFSVAAEWYPVGQPEHATLFAQELKSGMIFPLRNNHDELGMIVFGLAEPNACWDGRLLDRLGMFSDLISHVITGIHAFQALATSRSEARRLAGNLLTAQEDERRRISREIHDDICQRLVAAGMQLRTVEQQIDEPKAVLSSLARLSNLLLELSRDVQHLARKLHPAILDELGLVDAIRSECNRLEEAGYLQVDFRCLPLPDTIDKRAALCLYRILQESLWNVVKHARVKQAKVRLYGDAESLYLEVSDSGQGFKLEKTMSSVGLGIVSFKERVRLLGGKIEICSAPDQGTKILVTLPIAEEES